jgi:hypothetical protein
VKDRIFNNLLLFSLFGIAMWFFGNLYEGIVITPNLLKDSIQKLHDWQDFFVISNPIFFYIPLAPLATFIIIFLYLRTSVAKLILKKHLKVATIFVLLAFALGIFIVTQINLNLFFGDLKKYTEIVYKISLLWNILNAVRITFLSITLYHTFKAYIWTQHTLE